MNNAKSLTSTTPLRCTGLAFAINQKTYTHLIISKLISVRMNNAKSPEPRLAVQASVMAFAI